MTVRSFVFIALAANIFIVTCAVDDGSVSGDSSAVASTSSSVSVTSTKKKCIKVKRCPMNEEFSYCTHSIGRPQFCSQYGQTLRCSNDPPSSCKAGCVCKEGFLRNVNGTCILACTCTTECADSEVLDDCPEDCASDYCPISNAPAPTCETPAEDQCPPPVCKCRFNYRRIDNGSCIPTRSCPPFDCPGQNEEFNPCPPLCPTDDCSQASPSGECPRRFGRIGIVLICNPKCRCKKGYWRKEGKCVPYAKCPNVFPPYEEYVPCIQGVCRAMNCSQKGEDIPCPDRRWPEEECDAGCICKENYLRTEQGDCVLEDQCDSNLCPPKEEYNNCTQALCRAQNCTQRGLPVACPSIAKGSCMGGCVCIEGYLRSKNGTCVAEDKCDVCPENEELKPCPEPCSDKDQDSCKPVCNCKENYHRNQYGYCVSDDKPDPRCPNPHEEYTVSRKPNCPILDTCASIVARIICTEPEVPGCTCKGGYYRLNETSHPCIPLCQCPQMAGTVECQKKIN